MSNYIIWGLFGPATWPWWGVVLGLAGRRVLPQRLRYALLLGSAALFAVMAILPTGYWLTEALEQRHRPPQQLPPNVRNIVVLAGAERLAASFRTGRPEYGSAAERVFEAARLARELPNSRVWIVGGLRDYRSPKADIDWTAQMWQELGIDADRINKLDQTLNTYRNAEGFAAANAGGPSVLVTSAIHMPRSIACFRAHDVDIIPYPVDHLNGPTPMWRELLAPGLLSNMLRSDAAIHEWIGLAYYRLAGRTKEFLPARTEPADPLLRRENRNRRD